VGDAFVRFRCAERVEGEPTRDGLVIIHYDGRGRIAAVGITDMTVL